MIADKPHRPLSVNMAMALREATPRSGIFGQPRAARRVDGASQAARHLCDAPRDLQATEALTWTRGEDGRRKPHRLCQSCAIVCIGAFCCLHVLTMPLLWGRFDNLWCC